MRSWGKDIHGGTSTFKNSYILRNQIVYVHTQDWIHAQKKAREDPKYSPWAGLKVCTSTK